MAIPASIHSIEFPVSYLGGNLVERLHVILSLAGEIAQITHSPTMRKVIIIDRRSTIKDLSVPTTGRRGDELL